MICADPWDEVARLEDVLEAELLMRHGPPVFRSGTSSASLSGPKPAPSSLRRREPLLEGRAGLGWRYTGHTYSVDHF